LVGNARAPLASHVGSDSGAVLTGCTSFLRRAAAAHRHAGHVHVDPKINIANIYTVAVAVAKLYQL